MNFEKSLSFKQMAACKTPTLTLEFKGEKAIAEKSEKEPFLCARTEILANNFFSPKELTLKPIRGLFWPFFAYSNRK